MYICVHVYMCETNIYIYIYIHTHITVLERGRVAEVDQALAAERGAQVEGGRQVVLNQQNQNKHNNNNNNHNNSKSKRKSKSNNSSNSNDKGSRLITEEVGTPDPNQSPR